MITKIIFTALVILGALLYLRHKNSRAQQLKVQQEQQAEERRRAMMIAISLVVLTLLVSAGIYTWHWQQDHQIVEVRVVNSLSGAAERYQVYRVDLEGRNFRTVDGIEIHLSSAERMEIIAPEGSE